MTDETLSRFFIFSTGSGELTIENGRERGLHWSIFLQSLDSISGPGTQLKDIPNVAFKLSKRKFDDNLQMLHMILFGRKAKAIKLSCLYSHKD
ncbi:hypothetical protein V6N12_025401 [Hibiscus sabdariffa]|uniref:Uncharacterized protein n=1 Tax=Hibiscus sabdariffa TaxID=183260 RepID=A0ABR2CJ12_9ROSI